jgi:predicted ATPase/DNA-binding winged helix-turn-helix (wHTH) protein
MTAADPDLLRLPDGHLDLGRAEIHRDGETHLLLPIEVRFLRYLAAQDGRPVALDALHRDVWQFGPRVQTRAVYFAVRKLRDRLERNPKEPTVLVGTEARGFSLRASAAARATPGASAPQRPFVGRAREGDAVVEALGAARLVTLLGPGGVGKSAVAHRFVATQAARWPGGVWVADLSSARTRADLQREVARVLQAARGVPVDDDEIPAALRALGDAVLVLDTFEPLAAVGADALRQWLSGDGACRFLVTSRERLRLSGEVVIEIPPLDPADAARLFQLRAEEAGGADAGASDDVPALVEALDRLPLAIELAAARAGTYTPSDLLHRLNDRFRLLNRGPRDAPERQATLAATLDWSWGLSTEPERATLAQLSVFRGGFSADAAEAVVALPPDAPWFADLLQSLVDKCWVRPIPGTGVRRYDLLHSVQAFVQERTDPTLRCAAEARHGAHFGGLATPERRRALRRRGDAALGTLMAEFDNLHAACARAAADGSDAIAVETALTAALVCAIRGPAAAGVALLELALGVAKRRRGELLWSLGQLRALQQGDAAAAAYTEARAAAEAEADRPIWLASEAALALRASDVQRLEAVLREARAIRDDEVEAICLRSLAGLAAHRGRTADARLFYEDALIATRDNPRGAARTLVPLGWLELECGAWEEAIARLEEANAHALRLGDRIALAASLRGLAQAHLERSGGTDEADLRLALDHIDAGLDATRATGNLRTTSQLTLQRAEILRRLGDPVGARACLRDALALFQALSSTPGEIAVRAEWAAVELASGQPDRALAQIAAAEALAVAPAESAESWVPRATLLCRKAAALLAEGDRAGARAALDATEPLAAALRTTGRGWNTSDDTTSTPTHPPKLRRLGAERDAIRAQLDPQPRAGAPPTPWGLPPTRG